MKKLSILLVLILQCSLFFSFKNPDQVKKISSAQKAVPIYAGNFYYDVPGTDDDIWYDVWVQGTTIHSARTNAGTYLALTGTYTRTGGIYTVTGLTFYDTSIGMTVSNSPLPGC
jgi:hypothetical protein